MRKLLLATTALVGITIAAPASAAPVVTAIAGAVGFAAGTAGFAIVSGVVSMALSVGLSYVAQSLLQKDIKQEAVRAELTRPTSLPAYRFVYGKTWAPGTPVAWTVVGKFLYICYLLNSRQSAGPFTVLFDKRTVEKTGNEFDFTASGGATATNDPFSGHTKYWIGRGDQTTCPAQIVAETTGYFTASDAWRGRTVLWARLHCGDDEDRRERWPTTPPELNVDGNWSIVQDPRDNQMKFSRNQSLISLDALRNNPIRPYGDNYIRVDTFSWAADVAGQGVPVKAGGTIPRYNCDGVLTFTDGKEVEDLINPILDAGAARLTRIGGKLGIIPAINRASVKTISDVTDGQPLDLVRWRPSDELYTEGVARFPAPDRAYESAETPAWIAPGAQVEDGGTAKRLTVDLDFVTDHRQAQRIAKIMVMRSRMQRQIAAELFPDSFDLVAGSVCSVDLPAPYSGWNGRYEVDSIAPTAGLNDDQSVTLRLPSRLTETSPAITAWNATTEEQDMEPGDFTGEVRRISPPVGVSIISGNAAAQVSGDTTVPAILAFWEASTSASVHGYDWEWGYSRRIESGSGGAVTWSWSGWNSGGSVANSASDEDGVFKGFVPWVQVGNMYQYRVRVRALSRYGASGWVATPLIYASGPTDTLESPVVVSATPGASYVNIALRQSGSGPARELLIYGNDTNSPLTAELLWNVSASPNITISRRENGLASGETRYYFARARDQWGNHSPFSNGVSATIP